ncbi:MAG: mercuric reductase [Flavipsychrobacter sp.]|nr:mercuric reductase [Flavipsychrobacter sp.]
MKKYDAIIIGSGQAGTPLARRLAKAGWQVAIIEQKWPGGTCVNVGCTPTKTMVASAKMAYQARRSNEYGVGTGEVTVDMSAIIDRKAQVVSSFRHGSEKSLTSVPGIDLIYGAASFTADKIIMVNLNNGGSETLTAERIFINAGCSPSIPTIQGLEDIPYLTSETIMELKEVPGHLLIVGAGYIAMEFGQMYRRFGSKVTILEHAEQLLIKEDEDIAREILKIFTEEDIAIHTKAEVKEIKKADKGLRASIKLADKEITMDCTHVLVGAGRTPNTAHLGLEHTKIAIDDKGYIQVNDKLETAVDGVYALGDVKGGPAFTHISYNDYIVVCKNILDGKDISIAGRQVPYCMFTDPELGRLGMTEREARKKGLNVKVAILPMSHVARGIETEATKGLMKAVVDADTKQILGVAILGEQGGEIMSVLQMAMMGGIGYDAIRENIFAHPTFAESLNNLFMTLDK